MTVSEFQSSSSRQGRAFEEAAASLLKAEGWHILEERVRPGDGYPEIDIVATDPTGLLTWVEVKGSWRGDVPGLRRDDTVKKLIGVAADLRELRQDFSQDGETPVPFVVVTSHQPKPGTLPDHMLRRALDRGDISAVRVLGMGAWR